jgi:hypothetical protein
MEIVLEFMVTDGGLHAIERDVDQIAGNDIYIRHGLREQAFEFLEIAVDVGEIYEFHDICIGRQGFPIKRKALIENLLVKTCCSAIVHIRSSLGFSLPVLISFLPRPMLLQSGQSLCMEKTIPGGDL